jgi:hypothetical protein
MSSINYFDLIVLTELTYKYIIEINILSLFSLLILSKNLNMYHFWYKHEKLSYIGCCKVIQEYNYIIYLVISSISNKNIFVMMSTCLLI